MKISKIDKINNSKKCGISNCDNSINFDLLDKEIFKFDIDFDDF